MKLKYSSATVVISVILVLLMTTVILAEEVERLPRFNFNTIEGDKLIGQLGIFYPFKNQEYSLFYTDSRYRIDIDDVHEWNFGLGYRRKKNNKIEGIYIYRDRRKEFDIYWDMWTIGGEILTDKIDIRANAYIADDKTVDNLPGDSAIIKNGKLLYQKSFYTSMDGIDFEIGKRWTEAEGIFNDIGIYGRVFKFFEDDISDMNGKEIRINKLYGNKDGIYSKFGIKWRDDNLRGSKTEATLSISIPIGKGKVKKEDEKEYDSLEKRITEQPVRDLDVVVGEINPKTSNRKDIEVLAYDPASGGQLGDIYYITAGATGDGSKDNPTNINDAINNSKENDVFILLGDNGPIVRNNLTLNDGQKLLSPGGYLNISADANMNRKTKFKPSGKKAALIGESSNYIYLQKDNSISGLDINRFQIRGYISGKVYINNNTIKNSPGDAITLEIRSPGTTLTNIYKNNIINSNADSIELIISGTETVSKSLISENTIENSGASGIEILGITNGAKSDIKIKNNSIEAPNDYAINAYVSDYYNQGTESKILIENNLIGKYYNNAIYYSDPVKNITINNNDSSLLFIYPEDK